MAGGGMREEDEGEHCEGGHVTFRHYGVGAALMALTAIVLAYLHTNDVVSIPWSVVSLPIWGPPVALVLYILVFAGVDTLRDPRTWDDLRRRP